MFTEWFPQWESPDVRGRVQCPDQLPASFYQCHTAAAAWRPSPPSPCWSPGLVRQTSRHQSIFWTEVSPHPPLVQFLVGLRGKQICYRNKTKKMSVFDQKCPPSLVTWLRGQNINGWLQAWRGTWGFRPPVVGIVSKYFPETFSCSRIPWGRHPTLFPLRSPSLSLPSPGHNSKSLHHL